MNKEIKLISDGSLLFRDNHEETIVPIIHKIRKQIELLCPLQNDNLLYRIDWRILHGDKFGN